MRKIVGNLRYDSAFGLLVAGIITNWGACWKYQHDLMKTPSGRYFIYRREFFLHHTGFFCWKKRTEDLAHEYIIPQTDLEAATWLSDHGFVPTGPLAGLITEA